MKFKTRAILSAGVVWAVLMCFLLVTETGVFINKQTKGIYDYRNITAEEMEKKLPVQGQCYLVIDCVGSYISEKTYYFTGAKEEHTSYYYYIIPFDEERFMLLKLPANSDLSKTADQMTDALWNENSPYLQLLESGIYLDGILEENDPDIVSFYYDWREQADFTDVDLVPYTLNCTKSVSTCITEFWVGVGMLAVFLIVCAFAVYKLFGGRNKKSDVYDTFGGYQSAQSIPTPSSPTEKPSNGYNYQSKYDPTNTYQSGINGSSGYEYTGYSENKFDR